MKTAQAEEFDLLKDQTSYADSLDSLRLACRFIVPLQKVGQGGPIATATIAAPQSSSFTSSSAEEEQQNG